MRWSLVVAAVLAASSVTARAQVDCSLLDPRVSVSSEKEGRIRGSVDTLYKVAKADAEIGLKLKSEISNLQRSSQNVSESYAIAARTLYLFCGMVANARDIGTERKFELFRTMQNSLGAQKANVPRRSSDPIASEPTRERATRDERSNVTPPHGDLNVKADDTLTITTASIAPTFSKPYCSVMNGGQTLLSCLWPTADSCRGDMYGSKARPEVFKCYAEQRAGNEGNSGVSCFTSQRACDERFALVVEHRNRYEPSKRLSRGCLDVRPPA